MRKLVLFTAPVVLLVAMNGVYVGIAIYFRDASARLRRSYIAKAELQAFLGDVSHAEGGVGNYILARDANFLEPLDRARQRLSARQNRLQDVLTDSAQLGDLRNDLVPAADARLTVLERIRDHVRAHGEAPLALTTTSSPEIYRLQRTVARMLHREDEFIIDQQDSARVLEIWAMTAAATGSVAGVASGVIALIVAIGSRTSGAVRPRSDSLGVPADPKPAAPGVTKMTGSVLIVDDDARIRELLRRWLTPHGLELREAVDAKTALSAIIEGPPAVILCDVHMPGQDGLWLADRVRELAPTTAIVFATADGTIPPWESLRKGVVSYVLKPFQREQVVTAVQEGIRWSAAAAYGERSRAVQA